MEETHELVKSETLPEVLQNGVKDLRQDGQFIDFTIVAEGKRFAAHKVILAATSDFFRAMLQHSDSIESQTNECNLKDVSRDVLETILEFCYTSQIALNIETVREILMAASILQINTLQSLCIEYMLKRMNATNCLDFLILADRCNLPTLTEKALNFSSDKFDTISEGDEFLRLDAGLLSRIISDDKLCVANEEKVLGAVMKWIAAGEDRANELDNLVNHVRFVLFDTPNLVSLTRDEQVLKSTKYRELIEDAKSYLLLGAYPELRSQMDGQRFEPRCSLRRQQRIFAVGGYTDRSTNTAEKYDPYLDRWVEIKEMTTPRSDLGASILDDCLYAVGGSENGANSLSSVECYNIKEDFWRCDVAAMHFKRYNPAVCTLRGHIYAIGGVGGYDAVERYDPRTNKWEKCASLSQPRRGAGVAVCNGSIYVMGGQHVSVLSTVERFDESKNEWSFVAPMTTGRYWLGCTTFEGKIYAVGGCNDSGDLDTGECYDPIENRWEPIPPMSVKRKYLGLVETDGMLYAIGGRTGSEGHLKLVEAYDPVKKEWTTKCPMIYARPGGAFALYSPLIY